MLCPKAELVQHPVTPVFEWEKDVVNVHNYTGIETRQYLEKKVIDVAVYLHRMGAIDEQNIARFELGKKIHIEILNLGLNQ